MSTDQLVGWTMFALALATLTVTCVGMVAQEWHERRGGR